MGEQSDGDGIGEFVEASPVLHAHGALRPPAAGEEQWGGEGDGDGGGDEEGGTDCGSDSGFEDEHCAVGEREEEEDDAEVFADSDLGSAGDPLHG